VFRIELGLTQNELQLLSMCIEYSCSYISDPEQVEVANTVLEKVEGPFPEKPSSPYKASLELTQPQALVVSAAIGIMITNSTRAEKLGGEAEHYIAGVPISQLAPCIPELRNILRRLDLAVQMAVYEQEVENIRSELRQLGKSF
jgi:hypothetical protein